MVVHPRNAMAAALAVFAVALFVYELELETARSMVFLTLSTSAAAVEDLAQEQPLTVAADPRLAGVTAADYASQYALALRLRDAASAANEAVIRIREWKGRLAAAPAPLPPRSSASVSPDRPRPRRAP